MKRFLIILSVFSPLYLLAQDSMAKKNAWSFSGYLKDLEWVRFEKGFTNVAATNLVHNRMNIKWNPVENWTARLEVRNRLYWGDDVRVLPGFTQQLRNENEAVNLSIKWFEAKSAILHTNVERLWLEYKKTKWNIRAGRQRINWGITNTWNPNDLFNSYNFLDFDYEERPGSDAVKGQYLVNDLSNVEIAVAGTGHRPVIAARYFTNYHKYDLQWNAGVYQSRFTAGFGWAGSIKDAGFKGEAQFYADQKNEISRLLLVLEGDYMFKNGWYLSSAFLYNEKGIDRPLNDWTQLKFQASPRSLMPAKWNILINTSREFSPVFSGSMNVVYSPGMNMLILFPAFRYNLKTNFDIDFVWQSFFAETARFDALSHTGFLRLRWSF
ncbi:hypothetical protein A3860_13885 [Niastella vici]|uniref:Porin n=1 Tax=Niastella vici TaxID=1703345 RepID=A0A1V9G7W4_9BACT|nr:hypothetical protein [Niastella vici]OQP66566.1 hypothetical protein A3860_13885 [Niastella vici]